MKVIVSKEFERYFVLVPNDIKKKIAEKVQQMEFQTSIEGLNAKSLVGFSYIYKIEIDDFSFCFYYSSLHIELLGIVESGNELKLII